jgi:hypothetical protein
MFKQRLSPPEGQVGELPLKGSCSVCGKQRFSPHTMHGLKKVNFEAVELADGPEP